MYFWSDRASFVSNLKKQIPDYCVGVISLISVILIGWELSQKSMV